jgi:hypothetical protein
VDRARRVIRSSPESDQSSFMTGNELVLDGGQDQV